MTKTLPNKTLSIAQILNTITEFDPTQTKSLIKNLISRSVEKEIPWHKNITCSLQAAIEEIDQQISNQLNEIVHTPAFLKLEGSWRGALRLVKNSACNAHLKIKIASISLPEIHHDVVQSLSIEQTHLFKLIYEHEFGTPGGEPYAAIVGDYEFNHSSEDVDVLTAIAKIMASSFCPFITTPSPSFLGLQSWSKINQISNIEQLFYNSEYIYWNQFRETFNSRFVILTLPKALARLPYTHNYQMTNEFCFKEACDPNTFNQGIDQHLCWMSSAYLLAEKLTHAFTQYNWCTAIRGTESGGKVGNLPLYLYTSQESDTMAIGPTEVAITDRLENELSKLGFLPLCHYRNTNYAVFFGAESSHKAAQYERCDATRNALIAAKLPYIMATSRFAHYLKVMARDKIGSFMETDDIEHWLNHWILRYVNNNAQSHESLKSKYPLAEAKVKIIENKEKPGSYKAVAWLRPWLQLEELTASLRLVAQIPKATH